MKNLAVTTSSTPLSVLIVEDDPSFALELEMLVHRTGHRLAGAATHAGQALDLIRSRRVDMIIMDITLAGRMTGLEVGKRIAHLDIPVLYITSHNTEEHYRQSRMDNTIGYLTKPISKYSLNTVMELAQDKIAQGKYGSQAKTPPGAAANLAGTDQDYLFIRGREGHEKVMLKDIVLIEGAADYVNVYTTEGRLYLVRKTMTEMVRELGSDNFFRVHRSFIVNVAAVESIDFVGSNLKVLNREIPISRRKRSDFEAVLRRVE